MAQKLSKLTIFFLLISQVLFANSRVDTWLDLYDSILPKYIKEGKVQGVQAALIDYQGLRDDALFRKIVYDLARFPAIETLKKEEQLAIWINAYNIFAIKIIIENPQLKSIKDLDALFSSIWKKKVGVVAGRKYALDEIENDIIRAKFQEPRAHFAIVCASLSCPDLAPFAYRGDKLNEQLNKQMQLFLHNRTKGMAIFSSGKKIYLSKIFKWYKSDFKPSPLEWLYENKLITNEQKSYSLRYMRYNWTLNTQYKRN